MITKITRNTIPFFNTLSRTTLFCLSNDQFKVDQQVVKEILGVESCFNIKDVLNYVAKNKELQESDFIRVCHRMLGLKHTMALGDNYKAISNQIENLDVQNCSFDIFVSTCSILPLMIGSENQIPNQIFIQIVERIKKYVSEQPDKLNVEPLLSFLEVVTLYENKQVVESICQILNDKISEFKYKDQSRYFQIAGRTKLPSRGEKELFAKLSEKIESSMERLDVRNLISYYKVFKNVNPRVYKTLNLGKEIEQRIQNNIDELEEKDISSLVSFKSKSNIFLKVVHTKIIDSISNEGESSLEASTVLMLLAKITESGDIICYENSFDKLLKFIQKNINKDRDIKRLVRNNYFTRSQLLKISKFISSLDEQEKNRYHSACNYLYDLTTYFILDLDIYDHFLETAIERNQVNFLNERVIVSALIAEKLFSKHSDNAKIAEVRNHFINIIKTSAEEGVRFNPLVLSKSKIAEEFTKKFWNTFYKNIFDNVINGEEKLKQTLFNFAILSNDLATLNKLVELKKIHPILIKNLIHKVTANPEAFKGNFKTINKMIEEYVKDNRNIKIAFNYLCNWEVHGFHEPSEVKSFFNLASEAIAKAKININDFFTYLTESPQKSFKSSPAYFTFLFNYQEALMNKKIEEGEKSYSVSLVLLSELLKNKIINEKFAKYVLEQNFLKNEGFQKIIKQYCQILAKEEVNLDEIPINSQYLFFYARFYELFDNIGKDKNTELLNAVNQASIHDLEDALLNLNLKKKNEEALNFISLLLKNYTNKVKYFRPSLLQIVKNIEKLSLKSEEYKKFLEAVITICTRNMDGISAENLSVLLKEASERNLSTSDLLNRVLGSLKSKANKNESVTRSLFPILDFCLISCPEKTLEIFEKVRNTNIHNELFSDIELIDVENQEVFKSISAILSRNSKESPSVNIGVFEYLVSKNPKYAEFEKQLTLKNRNDNQCQWLREELVKFLTANEVSFEENEIKGFYILKVGTKRFVFVNNNFTHTRKAKIEEIASFLFNIPEEEKTGLKVLFVGSGFKRSVLAHIITSEITEINGKSSEFLRRISSNNKESNVRQEEM